VRRGSAPLGRVAVVGLSSTGQARATGGGTAAVRAVARAEWRAGRRSLLALGLLAGLVAGLALAAGVLADRTRTAYPRLVEATALDDARVLVAADQPDLVEEIARLPGVEQVWVTSTWIGQLAGPAVRYLSVGAGLDPPRDLVRPVVVEGRAAAVVDEAVIAEGFAADSGLGVGDELTLSLLTLEEIARFDTGFGAPDGETVRLRVVGVARMPAWSGALAGVLATPAFAERYADAAGARPVFVRLAPGADRQAFAEAFEAAAARADAAGRSVAARHLPPLVDFPTADVDPGVRAAAQTLTGGLAVFAAVVGAGGLLVVAQGLLRHHRSRRRDQDVESALGLTRAQRSAARVLAAVPVAVAAGAVAGGIALAAGVLEPVGGQARFEPSPGFRPAWWWVLAGGIGTALVWLGLVAASAAMAGASLPRVVPPAPSGVARLLRRRPALFVGLRLAQSGQGSRVGVPVAATVLGAAAAVAGIVAALALGASLDRLVGTPARYGYAADLSLVDAREADVAALVADPRVAALDVTYTGHVRLLADPGRSETEVQAYRPRKGAVPVETVEGRVPGALGEIALGPRVAQRLQAVVGDVLEVARPAGGTVTLRVTGVVVPRPEAQGPLGDAVVVHPAQVAELSQVEPTLSGYVVAAPGAAESLLADLSTRLEVIARETPDEIRNLDDLGHLPEILAAALAAVAAAGLAHALLTAARRHAREVAVLSVLGATPRQVRAALAVLALALVLPALAVGIPVGLGVARVLWWQLATATGVGGDLAVPAGSLAVLGPVVVAVALLLALVPARRTAPPAVALAGG